jgi:hypothetical protein
MTRAVSVALLATALQAWPGYGGEPRPASVDDVLERRVTRALGLLPAR